jgi:hypothetical protein
VEEAGEDAVVEEEEEEFEDEEFGDDEEDDETDFAPRGDPMVDVATELEEDHAHLDLYARCEIVAKYGKIVPLSVYEKISALVTEEWQNTLRSKAQQRSQGFVPDEDNDIL